MCSAAMGTDRSFPSGTITRVSTPSLANRFSIRRIKSGRGPGTKVVPGHLATSASRRLTSGCASPMMRLNKDACVAIFLLLACGVLFWASFDIRQPDYGVLMPEKGLPLRGTFLIDPEGTLRWSSVYDVYVGRASPPGPHR